MDPIQQRPTEYPSHPQMRFGLKSFTELNSSLIALETKLYSHTNPAAVENAESVLVTVSEAGSMRAVTPTIKVLMSDPRVKNLYVLSGDVAGKQMQQELPGLEVVADSEKSPLGALIELENQALTVLITPEVTVGPGYAGLFAVEAKKLFLMVESPDSTLGTAIADGRGARFPLASIQKVFCNDALTRSIAASRLPEVAEEKFLISGTGQADLVHQSAIAGKQISISARSKLGLSISDRVICFLGDLPDYPELPEVIRETWQQQTLAGVLEAVVNYAAAHPDQTIALLSRPHPKDQNAGALVDFAPLMQGSLPPNLKLLDASRAVCSFDDAIAATDVVMSTTRTELYNAPLRGKHGVFLAFENLGSRLFDTLHPQLKAVLQSSEAISVPSTSQQLVEALEIGFSREVQAKTVPVTRGSGEVVANEILSA